MATYVMPKVADSTDEYVVASIEVDVGDPVAEADVILIVETDKVDADVKAGFRGVVTALLVAEGAEVSTGDPVLEYEDAT